MRRALPILGILIFTGFLSAVNQDTLKKFEKTQVYKEKQVEVVKLEIVKPDIERYQKKTNTNINTGFFQLYKNNIRKSNRVLINKWLKEFK